jgi:hypothetical protein
MIENRAVGVVYADHFNSHIRKPLGIVRQRQSTSASRCGRHAARSAASRCARSMAAAHFRSSGPRLNLCIGTIRFFPHEVPSLDEVERIRVGPQRSSERRILSPFLYRIVQLAHDHSHSLPAPCHAKTNQADQQ